MAVQKNSTVYLKFGMGDIQGNFAEEIEAVIQKAIANSINFFALCAGGEQQPVHGRIFSVGIGENLLHGAKNGGA